MMRGYRPYFLVITSLGLIGGSSYQAHSREMRETLVSQVVPICMMGVCGNWKTCGRELLNEVRSRIKRKLPFIRPDEKLIGGGKEPYGLRIRLNKSRLGDISTQWSTAGCVILHPIPNHREASEADKRLCISDMVYWIDIARKTGLNSLKADSSYKNVCMQSNFKRSDGDPPSRLGGVNLDKYCLENYGVGAKLIDKTAYGWRCGALHISMQEACQKFYGAGAKAAYEDFSKPYSWYCHL